MVSFSSAENALSNDVKKHNTFSSQGTENPPFRFFGTRGIDLIQYSHSFITENKVVFSAKKNETLVQNVIFFVKLVLHNVHMFTQKCLVHNQQ